MEHKSVIKWHPGFYGALEYELRDYRDKLVFESEHELAKEPILMDVLIVKKEDDTEINNSIGRIFRRYNVIEYKSPDDELSLDQFYKTISYACLFKSLGNYVDEIKVTEISISIFRNSYPRELLKKLEKLGAAVEERYPGVYYVSGIISIPIQIVVTRALDDKGFYAFKVLTRNAREEDIRKFISETNGLLIQGDRNNVDAILQVSVSANFELYQKIRRDTTMCEALRELMKDEIEKDVNKGIEIGLEQGLEMGRDDTLYSLVDENLLSIEIAAQKASKTVEQFKKDMAAYLKNKKNIN
jgi:hypothetical protein